MSSGILGSRLSYESDHLRTCRQTVAEVQTSCTGSSVNSPASSEVPAIPGEMYASTCQPSQVWHSNFTGTKWTTVCNADLSHEVPNFWIDGAVVPTFDACIRMCDALTYVNKTRVDLIAWSRSGNSSAGIGANAMGQCWCVDNKSESYRMNVTMGIDCALREGTWDFSTVGTIVT